MSDKDDLRLMGIATRIFHGRPTDREDAEAIRQATTRFTDRIAALKAKLAEKDAQLAEARREALEEAAKVADGYAAAGKDNPQLAPISAQMRYCAQRIRALKENSRGTD